jgi:ATP-dependent DNA helicase RecQ
VVSKEEILKRYFGYDSFRPMQAEVIDTVLSGRDALILMPTGGGKSVCYQVPALVREGLCVVVTIYSTHY